MPKDKSLGCQNTARPAIVYPAMNKLPHFRIILPALILMACPPLYAAITVDDDNKPITEKDALNKALEDQQKTAETLDQASRAEKIDQLKKSNNLSHGMWKELAVIDTLFAQGKPYEALKKLRALEETYRGHKVLVDKVEHLTQSLRNLPEHLQDKTNPVPRASFGLLKNALLSGSAAQENITNITMPQLVRQLNYLAEHWEAITQRYGVPTAHRITQRLLFTQQDTNPSAAIYSPLLIKQCADTLRIIHNHITHKRHSEAVPLVAKLSEAGIYPPTLQIYDAYILRETGNLSGGLDKLKQLVERFPGWPEPIIQQVYYLTEVNQYEPALALIEEQLTEEQRPDIRFLKAACLLAVDREAESAAILKDLANTHNKLILLWLSEPNPLYTKMSEIY